MPPASFVAVGLEHGRTIPLAERQNELSQAVLSSSRLLPLLPSRKQATRNHADLYWALVAHREEAGHWIVDTIGAPHVGERSEKELIASFVEKIAVLSPQLVTFNGASFDLPVLRYRAMVHAVAAPGLAARPYFHRYTEDAVDLCDALSSFSSQAKATLHELCRVLGLPGKLGRMTGAEVEKYYHDGHVQQIAEYCESDVLNTYRVWLRYELFRGRLPEGDFQASEANLVEYVKARENTKPHLSGLM